MLKVARECTRLRVLSTRFYCSNSSKLTAPFTEDGGVSEFNSKVDYFSMFGIDKSYNIEISQIARTYKDLQRKLHPDKFVSSPPEECERSELWSAAVNDGYKILQKPLSRALYLLELSGYPLSEGDVEIDTEFLSNIMELNEEVAEAGENEIKLLEESVRETLDEYISTLAILFENDEYAEARKQVAHMKYYSNLLDKIFEKQSEFGMY